MPGSTPLAYRGERRRSTRRACAGGRWWRSSRTAGRGTVSFRVPGRSLRCGHDQPAWRLAPARRGVIVPGVNWLLSGAEGVAKVVMANGTLDTTVTRAYLWKRFHENVSTAFCSTTERRRNPQGEHHDPRCGAPRGRVGDHRLPRAERLR